jgi:hypothetical protein
MFDDIIVGVDLWGLAVQITAEECMAIATQAGSLPGSVLGEGARPVVVGGVKYMVLRADDNVFYIRQVLLATVSAQHSGQFHFLVHTVIRTSCRSDLLTHVPVRVSSGR